MTDKEAMKLVKILENIEDYRVTMTAAHELRRLHFENKALKERLAQPEQEPVACRTLCELCIKRGYNFCANAAKTTPITTPPAAQPALLQVSPTEFVDMVMDKEDAIGKPIFWAEWPNKEKNHE
jgi:hypothetical protein